MSGTFDTIRVRACICRDVSFARAVEIARTHDCGNVAELRAHVRISDNCRLCVPYVQYAIETGESEIPLMEPEAADMWRRRSGDEEPGTV